MALKQILKRMMVTGGLEAAALIDRAGLMRAARGRGAIFTLHHVRPPQGLAFDPNAHLDITPDFLDLAIRQLRDDGYRFVAVEDIPALLGEPDSDQPFAAFTLDDGYRDNAEYAAPVFTRHQVPFTIFVAKGFAERSHTIWWETAARLMGSIPSMTFDFGHGPESLPLTNAGEKHAAFQRIARQIIGTNEAEVIAQLDRAALDHGVDPQALVASLTMDGDALKGLSALPFARLGAHTVSHRALAFLDRDAADREMRQSADYIEGLTGRRPVVIAYPYGDRTAVSDREVALSHEAGFIAAVTTRPGTLSPAHRGQITDLPRISLNGFYQTPRYVSALASGIPFKLMGSRG